MESNPVFTHTTTTIKKSTPACCDKSKTPAVECLEFGNILTGPMVRIPVEDIFRKLGIYDTHGRLCCDLGGGGSNNHLNTNRHQIIKHIAEWAAGLERRIQKERKDNISNSMDVNWYRKAVLLSCLLNLALAISCVIALLC